MANADSDPCAQPRSVLNRAEQELLAHREAHGEGDEANGAPWGDERRRLTDAVASAAAAYEDCVRANDPMLQGTTRPTADDDDLDSDPPSAGSGSGGARAAAPGSAGPGSAGSGPAASGSAGSGSTGSEPAPSEAAGFVATESLPAVSGLGAAAVAPDAGRPDAGRSGAGPTGAGPASAGPTGAADSVATESLPAVSGLGAAAVAPDGGHCATHSVDAPPIRPSGSASGSGAPRWLRDALLKVETNETAERARLAVRHSEVMRRVSEPTWAMLRGDRFGHAIHPALTDLPLGSWIGASVLDATGSKTMRPAAAALVAFGVAAAGPVAATGWAEWREADDRSQRVGVLHAALNSAAVACYAISLVLRLRGRHGRGVGMGMLGGCLATAGGYLGGHLSINRHVGTSDPKAAG